MAGGTSLSKQIIRCERKAVLCDEAVAKAKVDLKAAIAGLRAARRNVLDVHRQLSELRQKRVKMDEAQVKRNVLKEDGLSPFRHICFSQLLIAEYENAGFDAPDWIAKITETDVKDVRTSALIEKYVVSSGMLSSLVDEATIRIIVDRIEGSMRRFSPGVSSEKSKKIWDEHPDWNLENALAIASRVRKEFAISHDLAVDVGKRNLSLCPAGAMRLSRDFGLMTSPPVLRRSF